MGQPVLVWNASGEQLLIGQLLSEQLLSEQLLSELPYAKVQVL